MTEYYARTDYVYSSGDAVFSIPFSYIDAEHISVYVNDVKTSDFLFLNESQIEITSPVLQAGDEISIRRETPIDEKMVVFTDTSILDENTQNLAQDQVFDAVQEIYDNNIRFQIDTNELIEANQTELEGIIAQNKAELEEAQEDFETEINTKIQEVSDAAEKINELEEAVEEAKDAADSAEAKAAEAATQAGEAANQVTLAQQQVTLAQEQVALAQQAAQDAQNAVNEIEDLNLVDTDLSNITEAGENVIKEIAVEEISIDRENYLNKSMLSNCVLKVSRRAEYQINSPTNVVLKAGAQLIKPNGRDINTAVYGSPTIQNGIVSNFTLNDYVGIPNQFSPGSSNWEIVFKWHTPSVFVNDATILGTSIYGIVINTGSNGQTRLYLSSNGSSWNILAGAASSNTLSVNTDYYLRLSYNGTSGYKFDVSTDNGQWTTYNSTSSTALLSGSCYINFGIWRDGYTTATAGGSIDLKESYCKIGDNYFWQGQTGNGTMLYEQFETTEDVAMIIPETNPTTFRCLMLPHCGDNDTTVVNTWFLGYEGNGFSAYSGEIPPTNTGLTDICWYNTAENKIRLSGDGGATWQQYAACFPVAIGQFTANTGITEIIQYLDVQSFIGSEVITFPGVTGYAPNGRNTDGTLKNLPVTSEFSRWTCPGNHSGATTMEFLSRGIMSAHSVSTTYITDTKPSPQGNINVWYDTRNNLMKVTSDAGANWWVSPRFFSGIADCRDGKIYDIDTYSPPNLTSGKGAYVVQTYKSGTSWYRIWSDGWCEQGGVIHQSAGTSTLTYLIEMANATYNIASAAGTSGPTTYALGMYNITTTGCTYTTTGNTPTTYWWSISGYKA